MKMPVTSPLPHLTWLSWVLLVLGRVVDAREIAAACTFLSSDAAASITGEDLNVNAGVVMF